MVSKKSGVIYILTNPSFPEYVKIGYADDLEKRMDQLNRSECLPYAFRAYAVYETPSRITDLKLHNLIDSLNPDLRSVEEFDGKQRKREFYAMSPQEAYSLLSCIAEISGTTDRLKLMKPEGHEVRDEEEAKAVREKRREAFKFSVVDLKPGNTVHFIEDPSITATVVDDRHIEYEGQVTSLSRLAQDLKGFDHPVQGTLWFSAEGRTDSLDAMRIEREKR